MNGKYRSAIRGMSALARGRSPGQMIIQYSDACNASCPQCELRATSVFRRSRIPMDDVKRTIDAAAARGFTSLSITGGEPLLFLDDVTELIAHAARAGIRHTRTGTNGFLFRGVDKPNWRPRVRRAARLLSESGLYNFWISIDSSDPATHEKMRGLPGVIKGIEKALPIFHEYGLYPAANLGINRNAGGDWDTLVAGHGHDIPADELLEISQESFSRFYRFVIGLGFTMANACYPMSVQTSGDESFEAAYGATSADRVVSFTGAEKTVLFSALFNTIPRYRDRIRIFTPRCSLLSMIRKYGSGQKPAYDCRGGIDYFFVDAATGNAFPCGFRGNESMGKAWKVDSFSIKDKPSCDRCDWECFRDPSDLIGPVLETRGNPLGLLARAAADREWFKVWKGDLAYFRACNLFSGRVAPNYQRMARAAGAVWTEPATVSQSKLCPQQ